MRTLFRPVIWLILIVSLVSSAFAQDSTAARSRTVVTAFASTDRVRFTSPSSVVQIRLEVYNASGVKVFDNEIRGGNVLDWLLQNGQAERLSSGEYLCVATVKSLSGRISQKLGRLTIEENGVSLQAVDASRLTSQQAQSIGPLEEDASLVVLKEDERQTPTVIAHNGEEGQITRGRGALSFRIGDFFSGKDTEQMRLTAEGNLGIGITHPTVKLEVDGLIRASEGIVFPDGMIQYSASSRTLGAKSSRPGQMPTDKQDVRPQTTGTGTQNQIAKWIDNTGTLGDSVISESSGNIGIGTLAPAKRLHVVGGQIALDNQRFLYSRRTNNQFQEAFGIDSNNDIVFNRNSIVAGVDGDAPKAPSGLVFGTGAGKFMDVRNSSNQTLMRVDEVSGNVGIGTANPQRTLQIGPSLDAAFNFQKSDGTPNAGYIRFGDKTGWKLHIARNRESSGGPLNSGTSGVLMTIRDSGHVGIGTVDVGFGKLSVVGSNNNTGTGDHGLSVIAGDGTAGGAGVLVFAGGGNFGGTGVQISGGHGSGAGNSGGDAIIAMKGIGSDGATSGLAAFFGGDVQVSGDISTSGASLTIDHPTDPENKYLSHSFVESPDMMNIYNGNAVTDSDGNAIVQLPSYFEALNQDFRYQLTVIGPFAQAVVADEIKANRFAIKTNAPNVKVSWQVTGVRHDAYANKNRVKVEENKGERERGFYLHPELFSQPEERGIEWARHPEMMRQMKEVRLKQIEEMKQKRQGNNG